MVEAEFKKQMPESFSTYMTLIGFGMFHNYKFWSKKNP